MIDNDHDAKTAVLKQESTKLLQDIRDFDCEVSSPEDLLLLFKRLDEMKGTYEDLISELEVDHFLEHGPGGKDV